MLTGTNALSTIIANEIQNQGGLLSFARFMELALYHPQYGYYIREAIQLGAEGDFTTAPEISPLFAQCFATQCVAINQQIHTAHLLEIGAGSGRFAAELLAELARLNALPEKYFIHEISPALRAKQQATLAKYSPQFASRVNWLSTLPNDFSGIIIANELLDALPVHCFQIDEQLAIKERCVALTDADFTWQLSEPTNPTLATEAAKLRDLYHLPRGYASEINLSMSSFLTPLITNLNTGAILFCDYGYGQREYYHPERNQGTLTCFYQHQRHANPLWMPGLQDITAHVDFTRVIDIATDLQCTLSGFTTQAGFLLSTGLIERAGALEQTLSAVELFALQQQIKTLTFPTEMGERIKLMVLAKNCIPHLPNLNLQDRRREL